MRVLTSLPEPAVPTYHSAFFPILEEDNPNEVSQLATTILQTSRPSAADASTPGIASLSTAWDGTVYAVDQTLVSPTASSLKSTTAAALALPGASDKWDSTVYKVDSSNAVQRQNHYSGDDDNNNNHNNNNNKQATLGWNSTLYKTGDTQHYSESSSDNNKQATLGWNSMHYNTGDAPHYSESGDNNKHATLGWNSTLYKTIQTHTKNESSTDWNSLVYAVPSDDQTSAPVLLVKPAWGKDDGKYEYSSADSPTNAYTLISSSSSSSTLPSSAASPYAARVIDLTYGSQEEGKIAGTVKSVNAYEYDDDDHGDNDNNNDVSNYNDGHRRDNSIYADVAEA